MEYVAIMASRMPFDVPGFDRPLERIAVSPHCTHAVGPLHGDEIGLHLSRRRIVHGASV